MDEKVLFREAVERWGEDVQLVLLMEECGELIQAASKYIRSGCKVPWYVEEALVKEAEDVRLMIDQLEYGVLRKPELWEGYRRDVFSHFKSMLRGNVEEEISGE